MYELRFDGLYRELPSDRAGNKAGLLCVGWLISKQGLVVARGHAVYAHSRDASSGTAEYLALIEGLEALTDMGIRHEPVEIMGDAKTVLEQMQGLAEVNSARIKPVWRRASKLAARFTALTWTWTPRRFNRAADQLTRRALQQIRYDQAQYDEALKALTPGRSKQYLSLMDLRVFRAAGLPAF